MVPVVVVVVSGGGGGVEMCLVFKLKKDLNDLVAQSHSINLGSSSKLRRTFLK